MKRRIFVQKLLATPAVPLVAAAAQETVTKPQQQPPPQPNTPARQMPQQPQAVPKLAVVQADLISVTEQRYFTIEQFAALERLGDLLMPPLDGHPGSRDAKAPEFLDFLIGVSAEDRQSLYRGGLDGLNERANKEFAKEFAELEVKQADSILRPLLAVRAWPEDLPSDPMKNFIAQVHEDLRTATMNSREWADAAAARREREHGFNRSIGYYWKPIDPVVRD
jgi:hypothetical protein